MDDRTIIIADRDAAYRSQVAELLRNTGYRVETTDSPARLMRNMLGDQGQVLLLGSDFDPEVSPANLIHLLKKCHPHLQVILVANDMQPEEVLKVRQEGVFYFAMKPVAGDTEELESAVGCAMAKGRCGQPDQPDPPGSRQAPLTRDGAEKTEQAKGIRNAVPLIVAILSAVCGGSYLSLALLDGLKVGSNLIPLVFLGFCALIITKQLLPIFRVQLPEKMLRRLSARQKAPLPVKK